MAAAVKWFIGLQPIWQALLATCFTWFVTALGASVVFFFKEVNRRLLDGMLGFAAGVMIAASFWSLLAPSIEMAREQGHTPWLPAAVGFLAGGLFLRVVDYFLPHLHAGFEKTGAEGEQICSRGVSQPSGMERPVRKRTHENGLSFAGGRCCCHGRVHADYR